ncbi:MAG: hypothetical protein BM555_06295 [Crocinitomix sp. MedPE-SWsnd]|nr:MAG: hypothetical protein BM555_06295 [Crocinitomix sp. MedPE-SWsnd]
MKLLTILLLTTVSLLTSCKKEQEEFGSKISLRSLSYTSVEISATCFLTGTEGLFERGLKFSQSPKSESHYFDYNETTINGGQGNGSIVDTFANLTPNTTYYCHPYAYRSGHLYRGEEISFTPNLIYNGALQIGDTGPANGMIFYADGLGGGKEVIYLSSWTGAWGCDWVDIPGTLTDFGSGAANGTIIDSYCGSINAASNVVANTTYNTYTDWYLPSKDELDSIYTNAYLPGYLNVPAQMYHTSSQINIQQAWAIDFADGTALGFDKAMAPGPSIIMVRDF